MPRYLLGIDNGGTVCKAALFACDGTEIAAAGRRIETVEPAPGHCERDAEALWRNTATAIREVIARAGVAAADIACVACAGHGNGLYLVAADGAPVRPGIYSTDSRAQSYSDAWRAAGLAERVRPLTAQCLWAGQPNALLAWLRDHEPETLARARWALMCKDYTRLRLTGEAAAELTDMSGTSLLNVVRGDYDDELLALFGLADLRRLLPPLVQSTDLCGTVTASVAAETGLIAGTPVAGGLFDIDACGLAAGMVDERQMSLVAGTWGCNLYVAREPLIDPDLFMTSCYAVPGWYLMLEGSPTSAANLEWFTAELLGAEAAQGRSVYDVANELVASVDPTESDLLFLPFLYGSNAHPSAKACLLGLEARHTRAHVLRAVYEGIVFAHHWHIQRLLGFRPAPECIRFTGGAARSAVWVQMFADCLQLPVEIPAGSELGALGAAICAAVACGEYPDYPAAVAAMTRLDRRHEPDPVLGPVYAAKYNRYQRAVAALDSLWSAAPATPCSQGDNP
jgi:L-xylulokinase